MQVGCVGELCRAPAPASHAYQAAPHLLPVHACGRGAVRQEGLAAAALAACRRVAGPGGQGGRWASRGSGSAAECLEEDGRHVAGGLLLGGSMWLASSARAQRQLRLAAGEGWGGSGLEQRHAGTKCDAGGSAAGSPSADWTSTPCMPASPPPVPPHPPPPASNTHRRTHFMAEGACKRPAPGLNISSSSPPTAITLPPNLRSVLAA